MQNNVQMSGKWSQSKPKVDFQYGGRLFCKNGSSYILAINWDMSTKFGLLIDFDLLKAATSTNAKPEIVLSGRGRHLYKAIRRPNRNNTISGFAFVDIAAFRSQWANQISSTYLNWWLRYNYFRFFKTNVRHTGNLLSVSISTICQKSAHYSASGYTELCPNPSTHCGNMTSYPFLKMAAATAEYYFRFRICWCHCLQKVKVY